MITFRAIASRYKRRDGLRAVSIRVTFKGRVRWLPTTIACAPADLTLGGDLVNQQGIVYRAASSSRAIPTDDGGVPFIVKKRNRATEKPGRALKRFRLDIFLV